MVPNLVTCEKKDLIYEFWGIFPCFKSFSSPLLFEKKNIPDNFVRLFHAQLDKIFASSKNHVMT